MGRVGLPRTFVYAIGSQPIMSTSSITSR
jgi:hypothetical protein